MQRPERGLGPHLRGLSCWEWPRPIPGQAGRWALQPAPSSLLPAAAFPAPGSAVLWRRRYRNPRLKARKTTERSHLVTLGGTAL